MLEPLRHQSTDGSVAPTIIVAALECRLFDLRHRENIVSDLFEGALSNDTIGIGLACNSVRHGFSLMLLSGKLSTYIYTYI